MRGGMLAALSVLALAATAAAQDACLEGVSTLGDQRALAALRAATDTACPCASFGGARGRRQYVRCVREQISAALSAGAVRRECKSATRDLYRKAACGTNRVTCGRDAGADAGAQCRLAAPSGHNACDAGAHAEHACSAQSLCSDVVGATAGTCIDPRQPGPFGVGVRTVQLTKDSVASPGTDRVLDTTVWYPAAPGVGIVGGVAQGEADAPLDQAGGPYPLLLFSHGSCGYPLQSTFLTALLASYGIIVAAPPHPGNTLFEFPDCGTVAAQVASLQERPADIIFVTDQLLVANQDNASPFFGAIDPARLGMSGHSFGGLTTYLVTDRDARYRVAIPMAAAVLNDVVVEVPSLTLLSAGDSVVDNDRIRARYAAALPPKVEVEIQHTGHYAYSNACFPSPDCNPPVTLTQDEAHAIVQRWVVPFVLRYLSGDQRFEPFFLAPPPPGVVVAAER